MSKNDTPFTAQPAAQLSRMPPAVEEVEALFWTRSRNRLWTVFRISRDMRALAKAAPNQPLETFFEFPCTNVDVLKGGGVCIDALASLESLSIINASYEGGSS